MDPDPTRPARVHAERLDGLAGAEAERVGIDHLVISEDAEGMGLRGHGKEGKAENVVRQGGSREGALDLRAGRFHFWR